MIIELILVKKIRRVEEEEIMKKEKDKRNLGELTELSYEVHGQEKKRKEKKTNRKKK